MYPGFLEETNARVLFRRRRRPPPPPDRPPPGPDDETVARIRADIRKELEKLSGMMVEWRDESMTGFVYLRRQTRYESAGGTASDQDGLVRFLTTPQRGILPRLAKAHSESRSFGNDRVSRSIRVILDLAIPTQIPDSLWTTIQAKLNSGVLTNAAGGLIGAEAVAARRDGKPVKISPNRDGKPRPDHLVSNFANDRKLGSPEEPLDPFVEAIYTDTIKIGDATTLEGMCDELRIYYSDRADTEERSPFVVVKFPDNKNDREAWCRHLEELQRNLAPVIFIEVCSHGPASEHEGTLNLVWNYLYPERERGR